MLDLDSIRTSKAIQRNTGRTFHFATRLLPERIRHATYVLYAFFRIADEIVDDPDAPPPHEQRRALERIRSTALGERPATDPILGAFSDVRREHGIPDGEVEAFIDAMTIDVDTVRYETYADLEVYLRGSSVAVAYMMLAVMGPTDPDARPHAKCLGEAFQLTNFLRDVREDVTEYDRIYFPTEILERYGVTADEIERLEFSAGFAAAMAELLDRTERRYRNGVAGIEYLPERCQFPVLLAAVLYAEHHSLIIRQGFDVLSARPRLSLARRVLLLAWTGWHWRRTGDPVTTFYRASSVPAPGSEQSPFGDGTVESPRTVGSRLPIRARTTPSPAGSVIEILLGKIGGRSSER